MASRPRQSPSGPFVRDGSIPVSTLTPGANGQIVATFGSNTIWASSVPGVVPPWGTGADGNLVVAPGSQLTLPHCYDVVSFAPGGTLESWGFVLRCMVLDLRNTIPGAIFAIGGAGQPGAGGMGGAAGDGCPVLGATPYPVPIGAMFQGGTPGGQGGLAGFAGANGNAYTLGQAPGLCGNGGAGGDGGDSTNPGGQGFPPFQCPRPYVTDNFVGMSAPGAFLNLIGGGGGGAGGGGSAVCAGGGGGGGAGIVAIVAGQIIVDATTAVGAIRLTGGAGGQGEFAANPGDSGGGAGAGAGGGWLYWIVGAVVGHATAVAVLNGGDGSNGGDGVGAGLGGDGGDGGHAGRITFINCTTGVVNETLGPAGTAGGTHVGSVGGAIGVGGVLTLSL
jgi:hypothetical protein